jgi:hypothetical protein
VDETRRRQKLQRQTFRARNLQIAEIHARAVMLNATFDDKVASGCIIKNEAGEIVAEVKK